MNAEQQFAYEWAKNQSYPSIAARHAKTLAEVLEEIEAAMCRTHACEVCKHNVEFAECDCECETCDPPCKCWTCTDGSNYEWLWPLRRRRKNANA